MDMYQKRKMRAEKKNNDSQKSFPSVGINWYPGHMEKAKREIKEKLSLIDIVYEVIDSRMPYSSKIKDIDNLVKNIPRILIMSKYDMCDAKETDKFIKYYTDMGYIVIPTSLDNKKDVSVILNKSKELMQKINEDRKKKGMKPRSIRALVIGVPNVGKSTLINKLVGKKKAPTGDKPGITKALGWIRINNDLELLDTPGILWPKIESDTEGYHLAALSSIREEILNKEDLAIYLLRRCYELYPEKLMERYSIDKVEDDIIPTLDIIAKRRGALLKGGESDYDKVYLIILRDIKEGYLGKITLDRL